MTGRSLGIDYQVGSDRLVRQAARHADRLHVRVANPLIWVQEMVR